jgi:outer membrane protein
MTRTWGRCFSRRSWRARGALADTKIGVVKLNRLFEEAPQALALQRSLTEEFAPRERDIRAKREELRRHRGALQQGEGFLSDDERRRSSSQFRDGQRDLQRAQNEFVEDLNLRRNERLGDLQRLFITEIQSYGQAQNFDLVLVEGFIHASDGSTSPSRSCRCCSADTRAAERGSPSAWS